MSTALLSAVLAAQEGMRLLRALKGGDRGQRAIDNIAINNNQLVPESILGRLSGSVFRDNRNVPRRMAPSRVHKASSAESILAHVLRQRGWTSRFREGRLSDRRLLVLLEDIRLYGRAWLRHEAEAFFGRYGDGESIQAQRAAIQAEASTTGAWNSELRTGTSVTEKMGRDGETSRSVGSAVLSPLKRWFDRMRQFVRELIFAGTMALKGGELSAQEAEQADGLAGVQAQYFDGFEREIVANPPVEIAEPVGQFPGPTPIKPPMSPKQATARAEQYANAAWQGAQRVQHATKTKDANTRWERRLLGDPATTHCWECPPLHHLGWQPVGTLPEIGDQKCNGYCLCWFEYSDSIEHPAGGRFVVDKNGVRVPEEIANDKPARKPKPKKLALAGTQEAIDKLLANPQFNEAMKQLKITMKVQIGKGG